MSVPLLWEVRRRLGGPGELPIVHYVHEVADPNPMPRFRLFRWLPR